MTTEQPEALRLADELCEAIAEYPEPTALEAQAAAELRRQHAHITELESQLAQRFDAADMATAAPEQMVRTAHLAIPVTRCRTTFVGGVNPWGQVT